MTKLVCKKCGYRFNARDHVPKTCPYCDKEGIQEEQGAEEIVQEVEDLLR